MKITTGGTGMISSQSSMVASTLGTVEEEVLGPLTTTHYDMNYGWTWFQSASLLYLSQGSFSTFTYNGVSVVPTQVYLIWQSSTPTYLQWIFTSSNTPNFSDMWTTPMPYFAIEITNNNPVNPTKTFDLRQEGGVDGGGSQVQAFGTNGIIIRQYAPGGDGTNWPVSGTTTPSLGDASTAGDHNLKNNYPIATRIRIRT